MDSTVLFCFIVAIASTFCIQATIATSDNSELLDPVAPARGGRQRRNCAWLGTFNHAACAGFCVYMGGDRIGGICQDGYCICRFEPIIEPQKPKLLKRRGKKYSKEY
ncbi:defensin-like [Chrysoperla carnea]|uniref:defensin-like n=1 Tax=Chrysoperla carnea TaxID=189513 RepID=UPI001D096DEC|nr:defensin-like [Chrysoperla carnea]